MRADGQLVSEPSKAAVDAAVAEYLTEIGRLRLRVRELEAREPERVEIPTLTDADRELAREAYRGLGEIARRLAVAAEIPVVVAPATARGNPPDPARTRARAPTADATRGG